MEGGNGKLMAVENNRSDNSGSQSISNDKEQRYDGKNSRREHFSLKSSQTQPFDHDRMSGRPTNSKGKPASDSASGSDNK